MSMRQATRWIIALTLGGFLGVAALCIMVFLWCLPAMSAESYCTGDGPIVGYMLVVSAPFAMILGAIVAGKRLQKKSLDEALRREAESYARQAAVSAESKVE